MSDRLNHKEIAEIAGVLRRVERLLSDPEVIRAIDQAEEFDIAAWYGNPLPPEEIRDLRHLAGDCARRMEVAQ